MGNVIDVVFQGIVAGSITFPEAPKQLTAQRTAGGFTLALPMTVRLGMESSLAPQPLLSNVSAGLSIEGHQIGSARHEGFFLGSVGGLLPTSREPNGTLVWADTLAALAQYEELRAGKLPQIRIDLHAEVCYLLPFNGRLVRSEPGRVVGAADVTYPTEVWSNMLRELGLVDYVFVQIPLTSDPPNGWESVWREVMHAREAFERGGETGWTACVVAGRRALEAWSSIEPETMWPGWHLPSPEQRATWAKSDRLMGLRWHLHQAAHPAAHVGPETWSREDARLMLSTLSALLTLRDP